MPYLSTNQKQNNKYIFFIGRFDRIYIAKILLNKIYPLYHIHIIYLNYV